MPEDRRQVVANNRRALHDYEILETFGCGVVLVGSEVKALRAGRCSIAEAFARVDAGEVWIHGLHIPPYSYSRDGGHEPTRPRKLLLRRREIDELERRADEAGITLVPLAVRFDRGLVKVDIGVGRGRKLYDKRQVKARADADRQIERALAARNRRG